MVATLSDGTGSPPHAVETDVIELNVLVTGASGLLGQKTAALALERGHEVYSIYNEHPTPIGIPINLDLTTHSEVSKVITKLKPDAILHAAAYTDVDSCETHRTRAWKINAEVTKHIARISTQIDAHLTYVSTDYVFDGEKGLYTEDDKTNPLSYYGYTKLTGEAFIQKHAAQWCIARPSVLYGWLEHKQNFATWLINRLNNETEVKVLTDQYVSPTLNTNLAEILLEIMQRQIRGILHTAGGTRISRHAYAVNLAKVFNLNADLIKPAKMSEMSWKARRPKDSSLNVSKALSLLDSKPLNLNRALQLMKEEQLKIPSKS